MESKQSIYIDDDSRDHSDSGPKIKIKCCRSSTHYALTVSPDSTFGDLKRLISQETGLDPKRQILFFKVIEKDNEACLQKAEPKNNSKLLLGDDKTYGEEINVEVVMKYSVPSKGCEVVAVVRSEDDKLAEQVAALKTVVCGGLKVAEKDIIFLTEMLERQLLKLDGIQADGEGRIQRKMEVDRVQSLVDTMDDLKAKNYATPVADDTTYLKQHISQETGLEPKKQRLFFEVIEKDNEACLQRDGLKNNSKLLLGEDTTYGEEINVEVVTKYSVPSKGCEVVAVVRSEDDKLAEQVAALKTVVCEGLKVAEKDIIFLTEMLERQLLKLDGIQAEGEGRIQRKMEVDHVQNLVDTMDDLKAKYYAKRNIEGSDAESPMSSSTKVAKDWEVFGIAIHPISQF